MTKDDKQFFINLIDDQNRKWDKGFDEFKAEIKEEISVLPVMKSIIKKHSEQLAKFTS